MRIAFFLFCLSLVACQHITPHDTLTTIVKDQAEAEVLLGQHIFMDHEAIIHDHYWQGTMPGRAWITRDPSSGNYAIMAQYETHGDETCGEPYPFGDSIHILGMITEIRPGEFDIQGTVTAGLHPSQSFEKKFGHFTFSRNNHPDFWIISNVPSARSIENYLKTSAIYLTNDERKVFNKPQLLKKIEDIRKDNCPIK